MGGAGVRRGRHQEPASPGWRERWSVLTRRRNYLVAPELQFAIIRQLMLLFFTGVGLGLCANYVVEHVSSLAGGQFETAFAAVYVFLVFGTGTGFVVMLCLLFSHRVAGPATKLTDALWRLSRGNVALRVQLRRSDLLQELGVAANAGIRNWRIFLDDMTAELARARAAARDCPEAARSVERMQKIMDRQTAPPDPVDTTGGVRTRTRGSGAASTVTTR